MRSVRIFIFQWWFILYLDMNSTSNKEDSNGYDFLPPIVIIICLLLSLTILAGPAGQSLTPSSNNHALLATRQGLVSSDSYGNNTTSLAGMSPNGLSIFGLNASYYSSFPVNSPYLSYQSSRIGQPDRGLGNLITSNRTAGIKFMVDISRMYPAHVYKNLTGGMPANYSLQSNFFINGSGSGGTGFYWVQVGSWFQYAGSAGNQEMFGFVPFFEWWWPDYVHTGYANYNLTIEDTASISPSHPLLVEGWEFAGHNASGDYVNVSLMYSGYIKSSIHGYFSQSILWFNATYYLGNGSSDVPFFELGQMNYGNQGVGIVGSAHGQNVWANCTYSVVIEELENNSFIMPQVSSIVSGITGEGAVGLHAKMIINQSSNPFGLPAYTPYAYFTNGTLPDYTGNQQAYFPIVVQGYAYPLNATVTAYASLLHRTIPVREVGNAFFVTSAGYGITPLVLNFSSPGYRNYSVAYYPSAVDMLQGVELHSPFVSLVPLDGRAVYGYVELPFPYVAYLMDEYIHANGGPDVNMSFWDGVASAWKEWFPLTVSAGGVSENLSWYYPYLFHEYGSVIFNLSKWSLNVSQVFYIYVAKDYLNSPVYIPYSFDLGSNATLTIRSTFLNQSFSMPRGGGEYNITASMIRFQIPIMVTNTVEWYQVPYDMGQVSWNGETVWVGESPNASFAFPYTFPSNGGSFQVINYTLSYPDLLNSSILNYSAVVTVYSYNGPGMERINVTMPLFNYSVAILVSGGKMPALPVHVSAAIGGKPNSLYVTLAAVAAGVALFSTALAVSRKRKGGTA